MARPSGGEQPTSEMINAACREVWNDLYARHGGSWESRGDNEVCVIQLRATMKAALQAALKSAPVVSASQNTAERLPSSDAATSGADTRSSAGTEDAVRLLNKLWSQIWDRRPDGDPKDTYRELLAAIHSLGVAQASPSRADVAVVVRTLLTDGAVPEYHTDDDRGLEEGEYVDFAMQVLSALSSTESK